MTEAIRILHVDDEPALLKLAAEFLERDDDRFQVTIETSAADALDRLGDEAFDGIISDYQMPDMDGLAFLTAVRETDPDLPFILFTGEGSENVASDALSAGVTDYLQKETGTEQYELLANRINNAVERYRAQERAAFLERIRAIVRDVNQALVRATSRQEIENQMCEIISAPEAVQLVVFSELHPEMNQVEPRTWAGVDAGDTYLDAVDIAVGDPTDGPLTPHERAVHGRDIAISMDIQADPAFDPWREVVRTSGFRSLAVVPIEYESDLYGLLALYGGQPRPIEDARDLLEELGGDIAHAMYAVKTQQELADSEARYRTLAETASDAILTIDASSAITYANPATEQLFGYTRKELRGESLTMLMPEQLRNRHRKGIDRYLRTGERKFDWTGVELSGQCKNGTEIPLAISFGEFEQDGEQVFTGIIRDVSERAARKSEVQRQNDRLDKFAGVVAHDLRTLLNVATGRLELAQRESDTEHLEEAEGMLERMNRLIEDLLSLARQGQSVDEVTPVPLGDVVDSARRTIDTDTVTVQTDSTLGTIACHESRVCELIENLFRNAVDHGGVDVTIRVTMLDGGFAVEDDGPGIPEADRDEVFEVGYTTKEEGTGFGLNIVKMIAEAHGWDISITESADGGARFEITGVELDQ